MTCLIGINCYAERADNNEIKGQFHALAQIEQKLKSFEGKLNKENLRYLQVSKNKKDIELKCLDLEKGLEESRLKYNERLLLSQKLLGQNMLTEMSLEETASDILQRKLYQKKLSLEVENLKKQNAVNNDLQSALSDLKKRFQELTQLESEIAEVLNNLEKDKKNLALAYVKQESEISSAKNQIKENKVGSAPTFIAKSNITIPLAKYRSIETKSKKGVIVKYQGAQEILSPLDGKVIYTGMLSTYGRVLMIDHGNQLRSVILGDNEYFVLKGASVLKGQKIGITKKPSENEGKLYFELRKNNQVQNTFEVLSSVNSLGLLGISRERRI